MPDDVSGATTQITSAGSSIQTKPLGKSWTRGLKGWLNGLLADVKAAEVQAGLGTNISQLPGGGRSVSTASSSGGGKPAGSEALEEVTGAVNGVPATLQVMTDGEGWQEIE